jgi:hypothetical protein
VALQAAIVLQSSTLREAQLQVQNCGAQRHN